ncbi:Unextended protein, partial [Pseudolycoriella hygida]
ATPVQITKVENFHPNKVEDINLPEHLNKTVFLALLKVKIENSNGEPIDNNLLFYPTFSTKSCDYTNQALPIIFKNETDIVLSISDIKGHTEGYLCYRAEGEAELHHLGLVSKFVNKSFQRTIRDTNFISVRNDRIPDEITIPKEITLATPSTRIIGLRLESSEMPPTFTEDGVPELMSARKATFRLFGVGFSERTVITFTEEAGIYGGACQLPASGQFRVIRDSVEPDTVLVETLIPKGSSDFFFCTKEAELTGGHLLNNTNPFMHQGSDAWLTIRSFENPIPIWIAILIIITCLCFSALFSGLNLGLMSLDRTEIKILKNTGTGKERRYAAKIQPVRDHGNFLLCSILLGNVLVNSTFTIILDSMSSGLIAVMSSTILIVLFGEITPQAICSRHGLAVGANTIFITKVVMALTSPIAYPVSKVLDFILGEEIGAVYNRERLKELVRVTKDVNDLDKDEVNIISGALELRKKTVADAMTHIEDAFMLSYDAILDFETVSEIMKSGFSRIPVYEHDRKNVLTLLFIKDLAFVDPDDNTPLRTLCEFYQNSCSFVFEDVTLDVMFRQFKEGHRGHMAFVHRVNNEGDGDPFYETVGLITMEDVIEELIQAEIMDETDVYTDNRAKIKRIRSKKQDFTAFAERQHRENHSIRISPQLTLATFQYLTTTVDSFKPDVVSETILRRLLNQDIVHSIKSKGKDKNDPSMVIYQQGKPVDYFVLILEGRVEVQVGRENLLFESGPFTYFGIQALAQNVGIDSPQQIPKGSIQSLNMDAMLRHTFVPDYSVRAVTDVLYVAIKRTLYLAAKRATLMERSQKVEELGSSEPIDEEVEKLLHSLDEDDRSITAHTANLNAVTPRQSKPGSKASSPIDHLVRSNNSLHPIDIDYGVNESKESIDNSRLDDTITPLLSPPNRDRQGS